MQPEIDNDVIGYFERNDLVDHLDCCNMERYEIDTFEIVCRKQFRDRFIECLQRSFGERRVKAMLLRYGFYDEEYTLKEIGRLFGVGPEAARRYECDVLRKLRFYIYTRKSPKDLVMPVVKDGYSFK